MMSGRRRSSSDGSAKVVMDGMTGMSEGAASSAAYVPGCEPQIEITLISLEGRKRTGQLADLAFQRLPERGRLTIESHVRRETRAGFFRRSASLLHASERRREIQVLTDRELNNSAEFRVIESDPPCIEGRSG